MSNYNAIDETLEFKPQFDDRGLIPCVTTSAYDNSVLMVAYMNEETIRLTLETGKAHYWSRSREKIWMKGETSENVQTVKSMKIDCDQDCILLSVTMPVNDHDGFECCHTGRENCFYRVVHMEDGAISLKSKETINVRDRRDQK